MKKGKAYRKEMDLLRGHFHPPKVEPGYKPDPKLLKKGCWTDKIW